MTDEKRIIQKCQQKDMRAFGELYERYKAEAYKAAYLITGSTADAEDVTQDVFVKLFRSIDRFDLERPFRPWLHRIVINTSLNLIRRRRTVIFQDEYLFEGSAHLLPDERIEVKELQKEVRRAIDSLGEKHRLTVIYRHFGDFSYREISEILECSIGTVKSRLHYAYRTLRRKLQNSPEFAFREGIEEL